MTRAFRNYNYSWLRVEPNYDSSFNRPLAGALKSRISIRYRYGLAGILFFPEEAENNLRRRSPFFRQVEYTYNVFMMW